jgi:serine O-acetyltransferase
MAKIGGSAAAAENPRFFVFGKSKEEDAVLTTLREDYRSVRRMDPSIPPGLRGFFEIVLCTPGFWAIFGHRLFHFLHKRMRLPVLPRFLSLVMRWFTGIEIHPGAEIGRGVFIDHGMGVVIGETARVGDGVTIYQGVTLGARGNEAGAKRHPTVEAGAFLGSGAKILGDITVGRGARIGAGAVVVEDVPPETTVVGFPAFAIRQSGRVLWNPKTLLERLDALEEEYHRLHERLKELENAADSDARGVA